MASCLDYLGLWPADQQAIAGGVCLAESGDRLDARCLNCAGVPEDSNCWWQINLNAHPQYDGARLRSDPAYCAQAAFEVWQAAGWHAWSTYTNGAYLAHLDQASAGAPPGDGQAAATASAAPDRSGLVLLGFAAAALYLAGVL